VICTASRFSLSPPSLFYNLDDAPGPHPFSWLLPIFPICILHCSGSSPSFFSNINFPHSLLPDTPFTSFPLSSPDRVPSLASSYRYYSVQLSSHNCLVDVIRWHVSAVIIPLSCPPLTLFPLSIFSSFPTPLEVTFFFRLRFQCSR